MTPDITRVSDLRRQGASDREIKRATAGLIRLCKGSYAPTPDTPETEHLLRARALTARLSEVAASHTTAALAHGLPLRREDLATVQLSPQDSRSGNPKSGPGFHMHARRLDPRALVTTNDLLCTQPAATVLDCARLLDSDWGIVIAEAALHRGLVTHEQLEHGAAEMRGLAGVGRARMLHTRASGLSESPGESLGRLRLLTLGHAVEQQVVLTDVPGRPRVDALLDGWLVVEFDGRSKYALSGDAASALWAEKLRHDHIVETGYEVLRLTWADLKDLGQLRGRIERARERRRQRFGVTA